ncbi:MAG: AI-2E family transporter [Bacilli bacterium]|nr:AI-2E family transporter [Bacilli bacterium]
MANKINYKLVNVLFILLIIYLIYMTSSLWLGIISVIWKIIFPFLIAFVLAYALSPLVNYLRRKAGLPKGIAITLVLLFFILLFGFVIVLVTPHLIEQTGNIFNGIITFFKELSLDYNVDFNTIQKQLSGVFNDTLEKLGTYVSDGAFNIIGMSLSIISNVFIVITAFIYFMIDMDKIKQTVKEYVSKKSKKIYTYLSILNVELENYLSGFVKICFISFFQYTIMYAIIGHPDALMLGTLAGVSNLIPYFGGIITNIVAAITAFVISPELFIKTIIVFVVFSAIDGNVINPLVYGKTNKIHPLVVIISVFAGGILFGITGIIVSLPVAIILIATYKYFKSDISEFSKSKLKKKG